MFRTLAALLPPAAQPADQVFLIHPLQLSRWLEEIWAGGSAPWPGFFGAPAGIPPALVRRLQLPALQTGGLLDALRSGVRVPGEFSDVPALGAAGHVATPWEHLVYAYLVESTGVVDILREVVHRYAVGESLEARDDRTQAWLRTTEELFFREPPLFAVAGLVSNVRPDQRVNRRNAYWRMFGMDLPHPVPGLDGQPWKADAGAASNVRFGEIWTELLRQVWIGIENDGNTSGTNPTDNEYIAHLARSLSEMLLMRRRNGMLAREEFAYVSAMSWFHLLVESDNVVVGDLQAGTGGGTNAADRLARIAERVGITPPRRANELFLLADLVSPLLRLIEAGRFNNGAAAAVLYSAGVGAGVVRRLMSQVINYWQSATGERIKDAAVRVAGSPGTSAQPVRLPSANLPLVPATAGSTNGAVVR